MNVLDGLLKKVKEAQTKNFVTCTFFQPDADDIKSEMENNGYKVLVEAYSFYGQISYMITITKP